MYLPEVNYVMMVLTVIVVAIFKTTTILGNAYGGHISPSSAVAWVLFGCSACGMSGRTNVQQQRNGHQL